MVDFNSKINKRLEASSAELPPPQATSPSHILHGIHDESEEFIAEYNRVINSEDLPNVDDDAKELNLGGKDTYIHMEIGLPRGEDGALEHATVKRRQLDDEGNPIGKSNANITLDSREYEVEFLNGELEVFTANTIAENLLAQVDK